MKDKVDLANLEVQPTYLYEFENEDFLKKRKEE